MMRECSNRFIKILAVVVLLLMIYEISKIFAGFPHKRDLFDYSLMDYFDVIVSAFVGLATLRLGYVANKQNETMNRIEESREKRSKSCEVALQKYKDEMGTVACISNDFYEYDEADGNYVIMRIENCGEAMLQRIRLDFGEEKFESYVAVNRNDSKNVEFIIPDNYKYQRKVKVTFISCYEKETYGDFEIAKDKYEEFPYIRYYHYYADNKSKIM